MQCLANFLFQGGSVFQATPDFLIPPGSQNSITGNLTEANNRHEYAYEVQQRMFSPNNLKLLKPLYRLADWYTENSNILPARTLYIRALGILQSGDVDVPDA